MDRINKNKEHKKNLENLINEVGYKSPTNKQE